MTVTLASYALTSLEAVKEELGISVSDTSQDNRLTRLINAASSAIAKYCSRSFERALVVDERQPLAGGPRVVFNRPPLNEITSITVEDQATTFDTTAYILENAEAGIVFMKAGLPAYSMARWGIAQNRQPGTEAPILLLTYDGGYTTQAQSDEEDGDFEGDDVTLPPDLETACIDLVSYYNAQRGAAGVIVSETLGDASVDYADSSSTDENSGLPAHIVSRIRAYKRLRFI